ncbi:MAG: hypothetical protein AUK55_07770 [Syntrophobacteraceae bacterium CG2_30_61_12]|nr:MAG: hypothetical protein AUK55_07770 [Syntrophobacteraceae bacterium CG2_30_61_12]PIU31682.1 MAG: hypothetical protein COT06_06790 [Syntrophobacteraceae bacterium CG07_land_8_20_14_0_80_61_8]
MKQGMILYLTEEKQQIQLNGLTELIEASKALGITTISVATSQEEVLQGWWHLAAYGVQQVHLMMVTYDSTLQQFDSRGTPVRLCGWNLDRYPEAIEPFDG